MLITVNDRPHDIHPGSSISDLLVSLKLPAKQVAVEVNGELVPREIHADHELQADDTVEIVTLVGGG